MSDAGGSPVLGTNEPEGADPGASAVRRHTPGPTTAGFEIAKISVFVETDAVVDAAGISSQSRTGVVPVAEVRALLAEQVGAQVQDLTDGDLALARVEIVSAGSLEVVLAIVSAATALSRANEIIQSLETVARLCQRFTHVAIAACGFVVRSTTARISPTPQFIDATRGGGSAGERQRPPSQSAGVPADTSENTATASSSRLLYISALNVLIGVAVIVLLLTLR